MFTDWLWSEKRRALLLLVAAFAVAVIAFADWQTKVYVSLGFLYLFPIMLAAPFLNRWLVLVAGLVCAVMSIHFGDLPLSWPRVTFETLAFAGCGLFVGEVARNRRDSWAQEQRMRVLIETSPAAILTVNGRGVIELANRAASDLLAPREETLVGSPIAAFLPDLHYALRTEGGEQFRASLQCHAHRGVGEAFTADVWFSTFVESGSPKLAAILAEAEMPAGGNGGVPEPDAQRPELSPRETEILRLVTQGLANKEIGARLELSESSVKNGLQQLFSKLGVRTRAQLVRVALERYRDVL